MLNNLIQFTQTDLILIVFIFFLLFVLYIFVCISIIRISKNIKRIADLEYKKYNEEKLNVSPTLPSA